MRALSLKIAILAILLMVGLFAYIPLLSVEAAPAPAEFVPLTNLPGLTDEVGKRTLADYLNVLFRISIGVGALAAVIQITLAGIKYMATDAFSSKEEAKKDITAALFGLLIMLSTVVILQLIYPNILKLNVLQQLTPVEITIPPETLPDGVSMMSAEDIQKSCTTTAPCKLKPGETIVEAMQFAYSGETGSVVGSEAEKFRQRCGSRSGRYATKDVQPPGSRYKITQMFCIVKAP